MAGAELIGREELAEIQELFSREKVNLYRYGGGNYKAREFEMDFFRCILPGLRRCCNEAELFHWLY